MVDADAPSDPKAVGQPNGVDASHGEPAYDELAHDEPARDELAEPTAAAEPTGPGPSERERESRQRSDIALIPAGVPPRRPAIEGAGPLDAQVPERGNDGSVRPVTSPSLLAGRVDGARASRLGRAAAVEGAGLSPSLTAVFGGLFGLATIASIFALLIQVFPVTESRTELPAGPLSTQTDSPGQSEAEPSPSSRKQQRVPLPGPWRLASLATEQGTRIVSGEMQRRSFIIALGEAGVPKAEIYRILKAMDGVVAFDRTGKHDKFSVAMSLPAKRVVAFEYEVSPIKIYQAREDDQGLLRGASLDMKVAFAEVAGSFYVAKDIHRGVAASVFEEGIVPTVDEAFRGRISTEAFDEGGTVRALVTEMTALGLFVRYERAKAVEYRPADPAQPPWRAYHFEGTTYKGYVDEKGRAPSQNGWRSPVPGAVISSPFNPKRMHPVLKRIMPHQGTDYAATSGTPVYAAFRGTVASTGISGGYGNLVILDHPGGIQTYYAHLSRFAAGLKGGMRVGTHQLIGYVGSTGRSTGPHLHFGAKKDGKFFDAMSLHLDAWRPLPAADRAAFLGVKQQLDAQLEAIPLPDPVTDAPPPLATPEAASSAVEPANPPDGESDESDTTDTPEPAPAAPTRQPRTGSSPSSGTTNVLEGEDLSLEPE